MSKKAKTGTTTQAAETRSFQMHQRLLVDVIKRQAGDLHKAILEGVMNGVDAKATEITINLSEKTLYISDNGVGITSKQDIYDCWETFGQPPREDEKKTYGYFRMGRGQLFAFGQNKWRTGPFTMTCDIEKTGLNYDLVETPERVDGCTINIELYKKLLPTEIAKMQQELEHSIKYVPANITFNGTRLTVPIDKVKWDEETEDAYVKLKDTGTLAIFNLGVLVCYFPQHKFGCGGEVVSRKQLKMNFARNEVMSDCPVMNRIRPYVNQKAAAKISRQPALNDGGRQKIADLMIANDIDAAAGGNAKVITDVTGRHWCVTQLHPSVWNNQITVAPQGERRGDRMMQLKLGFVVGQNTMDRFRVEEVSELISILKPFHGLHLQNFKIVPFDKAAESISTRADLLPEKEWTPTEEFVIHVLRDSMYHLYEYMADLLEDRNAIYHKHRRLRVGISQAMDAWTDGETYIAINRDYIQQTGWRAGAWSRYASIIVHELCHEESDLTSHVHGPEFHEKFHEWMQDMCIADFTRHCIEMVPRVAAAVHRKVPMMMLKQQDKVVKAERAVDTLEAAVKLHDPADVAARTTKPSRKKT